MKKKRQQYKKQIRRNELQDIFRKKREQCFKFRFLNQNESKFQEFEKQIQVESKHFYEHFYDELLDNLKQENVSNLMNIAKQSYFELKKLIEKAKTHEKTLKLVIQRWFSHSFNNLLIEIELVLEKADKKYYESIQNKEFLKYAVNHFYTILNYSSLIQSTFSKTDILNFLFRVFSLLSGDVQTLRKSFTIVYFLIQFQTQTSHQFFFWNQKTIDSKFLLTFQNLCFIIFHSKQKLSIFSHDQKQNTYLQIKLFFIEIFKSFGYQLKHLESFYNRSRQSLLKKELKYSFYLQEIQQKLKMGKKLQFQQVYQKTIFLYQIPQKISLNKFLKRQSISIVLQTVKQLKKYYLFKLSESHCFQEDLANCIQGFRLLMEFCPKKKILEDCVDQLQQFIDLLAGKSTIHNLKMEIIYLFDMVIYVDEQNKIVEHLLKNHNMFGIIWSCNELQILSIKLNIISNLLLFPQGFRQVDKHISQICIGLHDTDKFISERLSFVHNYFTYKKYNYDQKSKLSRDSLVIGILYNEDLDLYSYKEEDIEIQIYIFSHLYDNGLRQKLPSRYFNFQLSYQKMNQLRNQSSSQKFQELDRKYKLVSNMLDIYNGYSSQICVQSMQIQKDAISQ